MRLFFLFVLALLIAPLFAWTADARPRRAGGCSAQAQASQAGACAPAAQAGNQQRRLLFARRCR